MTFDCNQSDNRKKNTRTGQGRDVNQLRGVRRIRVTGFLTWNQLLAALIVTLFIASPAVEAQQETSENAAVPAKSGSVTGRPLPRFVSMKASVGRLRVGPSSSHRIIYEFTQPGLPLKIVEEHGLWRRVETVDGLNGWMHSVLLTGKRYVMVTEDFAEFRVSPTSVATVRAQAEKNVIAELKTCLPDWCAIRAGGYQGWVHRSQIWGIGPHEFRE